jgi:hypothetical protein
MYRGWELAVLGVPDHTLTVRNRLGVVNIEQSNDGRMR